MNTHRCSISSYRRDSWV